MSTSPVKTVAMPNCSVEPIDPECIGVFWDVVNFPFPEGLSPDMIYDKTRLFLRSLGRCSVDMSIMAYVDNKQQFDDKLVGAYKDAGIDIIPREVLVRPISEEDKFGKVTSMLLKMIASIRELKQPANFIVISEPFTDPICDLMVEGFKLRGFKVLFEQPDYLLTFGSSR